MITNTRKMRTDQQPRLPSEGELNGRDHTSRRATDPTVVHCYDVIDRIFPECGILDLTEGMYLGDPSTPYDVAQQNQINWLLDRVQCRPGSRLLDIGCGNGTLLNAARHTLLAFTLAFTASWQWQFRDRTPPTRLLRFVLQRKSTKPRPSRPTDVAIACRL